MLNQNIVKTGKLFQIFGLPFTLLIVALMVRIPWLWEIPRYIDELREVNLAYLIYLKQVFPLHNFANDIGALHNYILAGIFALFGPNVYWPRLYVAITSAITVVLVFYLGKRLSNQWTGLIAAGLLLTNGMHILVTHMAWSNCTTPFFFVLAIMSTMMAEKKKSGRWLMLSGLLWAMTLQTHSSVIIYLMIVIFYILQRRFRNDTGIKTIYYYGAAGAFLIGYSNMIIYNCLSGFASIRHIFTKQYTLEQHPGVISFGSNLFKMFIELIRSVSSTYQSHNNLWEYFGHPEFSITLLLLGGGIYLAIKHRKTLPVWMIIGGFLIIPWINHRYNFFIVTRYIMPIIICAILLIAYAVANLIDVLQTKMINKQKILFFAIIILLIVFAVPLLPFYQYCTKISNTDLSNHVSLKVLETAKKIAGQQNTVFMIDNSLASKDNPYPLLFKMSNLHFFTLPVKSFFKRHPDLIKSMENHQIAPNERVVAILTHKTYYRFKGRVPIVKEQHFIQQLILDYSPQANKWSNIYLVEIAKASNFYTANNSQF